jgi:hypothetical protein
MSDSGAVPQEQSAQPPPNNMIQVEDDDPLLIAQTLTYVTDDGSVVSSFHPAPYSLGESHWSVA